MRKGISSLKVRSLTSKRGEIGLELGSGGRKGHGSWITVDVAMGCDVYWDFRDGLPFSDNRVTRIYSSHLFEHLAFDQAELLFKECLRVLVPNGLFSICVPDSRPYIEAYYTGVPDTEMEPLLTHKPAVHGISKIDYINYIAYMGGEHQYMFDQDNLVKRLSSVGFRDARARDYDESLDLCERQGESIYAEAYK